MVFEGARGRSGRGVLTSLREHPREPRSWIPGFKVRAYTGIWGVGLDVSSSGRYGSLVLSIFLSVRFSMTGPVPLLILGPACKVGSQEELLKPREDTRRVM